MGHMTWSFAASAEHFSSWNDDHLNLHGPSFAWMLQDLMVPASRVSRSAYTYIHLCQQTLQVCRALQVLTSTISFKIMFKLNIRFSHKGLDPQIISSPSQHFPISAALVPRVYTPRSPSGQMPQPGLFSDNPW